MPDEIFDITIIGAGPVGLYALYYAGLRDARAKIIEALDEVGGALKVIYPEKYIFDVAGYPRIPARELATQFEEQARTYNAPIILGQRVVSIKKTDDGIFILGTADAEHYSRSVIISAGTGAFIPKKLDIPSVRRLEGAGVYYNIKDTKLFRDKRVLIAGGGDSAVDNALMLLPTAKKITLIHSSTRFHAHEDSVRRLKNSSVEIHYPFWEIKELYGDGWIIGATVVNSYDGREMTFDVDMLVLNLGFLANLTPLRQWGLDLVQNAVRIDECMRTNIPGIFAAGDIAYHPGKLKLISTGTGEAAVAVNNAVHMVDPAKKTEPGHSSRIASSGRKKFP